MPLRLCVLYKRQSEGCLYVLTSLTVLLRGEGFVFVMFEKNLTT